MARLLILLMVVSAAGCSAPLTTALIPPDEPAYIEGTIIDRDNRFTGSLSARVSDSGTQVADVMLESGPEIIWSDGALASIADLSEGRVVTVWVCETELRSYPPVVTAEFVVIRH